MNQRTIPALSEISGFTCAACLTAPYRGNSVLHRDPRRPPRLRGFATEKERGLSANSIVAATVGEAAYRQIRADIVFGRLAPGRKLKLEGLRETYEAGISTLREILSRLSSEGLVVAEEQRGFQVAPISTTELKELAALRLLLECSAMEQSFRLGDIEWEGRVVSAHHKLASIEARMLAGEDVAPDVWMRYDFEYHQALVSACPSTALLGVHASVYDRYLRYLMIAAVFRGEVAAGEHQSLLACALKRDAASATSILTKHVNDCVTHAAASHLGS